MFMNHESGVPETHMKRRMLLFSTIAFLGITSVGLAYTARQNPAPANAPAPVITSHQDSAGKAPSVNEQTAPDEDAAPEAAKPSANRRTTLSKKAASLGLVTEGLYPPGRYRNLVFESATASRDIAYKSTYLTKGVDDGSGNYTLEDDLSKPTSLRLNIYEPAGDSMAKRPMVILVYGGGWTYGDRNQREDEAIDFARRGYVAMTMDYTMIPEDLLDNVPSDDQGGFYGPLVTKGVDDIYDSYKYMVDHKDQYRIDETRIGIGGWSVGGLMIATLANTNATDTPYGLRAVLPASSIFPSMLSEAYGGWRTFDTTYNPKNLFVSFADDEAQNGPYSPETDCEFLNNLGHACSSILPPGNFHEIFFNQAPLQEPAVDFFATNVAGH